MTIAVLSGKGGTGKTLVSVNLACAAGRSVYVDCDVEEPNGHLFLKPEITQRQPVSAMVPEVEPKRCSGCKKCVDFCRYNALAMPSGRLMIFDEVCHSCGGCILLCPEKALRKRQKEIGSIETGTSGDVTVLTGCLNTGEATGVPIIKGLMERIPQTDTAVIDCPPGSACIVMESIQKADFCLLVAEPTLFRAHNLAMVYDLVKLFNKPHGAVLNKCLPGENPSKSFCIENQIDILAEIPFDEELGRLNAKGHVAVRENSFYLELFQGLLNRISKEAVC